MMRFFPGRTVWAALLAGVFLLAACSNAEQAELERLRQENERLRAQAAGEGGATGIPQEVAVENLQHFTQDAARGTLAGLLPGDTLADAEKRFGPIARTRRWRSEGRPVIQHEWDLDEGLVLRVHADPAGRLQKIAVALDVERPTNIPTFAGLRLGQETFASVQARFGSQLVTDLQLWGARGLYTVLQRAPLDGTGYLVEFVFQMPEGVSTARLETIGAQVQRERNGDALEAYLKERMPFQIGLEQAR